VSPDTLGDGSHDHSLRVNSLALSGIRNKHDVFLLSDQRRECLKRVLKAAEFLVASIGGGEQAVDGEYGESIRVAATDLDACQEITIFVSSTGVSLF
jgi:hypothetical protein